MPQSGYSANGALGSRQVAEVTVPRAELEKLWSPEHLESLARTYWSFLSRFSLGLIRVLYGEDSREVVFLRRPFVLLRFRKPEYHFNPDGGTVTWPIDRGVLVARRGRGRGFLRLTVHRQPVADGAGEVTLHVSSEVVNFYPTIADPLQPLDLRADPAADPRDRDARVPALARQPRAGALARRDPPRRRGGRRGRDHPTRSPVISRSLARSWRAVMRRTVPERERIEIDSVVAPSEPM